MTSRGLVVGNWKMHGTIGESLKLVTGMEHHLKAPVELDVAVAPPFTALYSVGITLQETQFHLAAQDLHWEDKGAFPGEISGAFLRDIGCEYVIVGHSERRRWFGDTDDIVNKKLEAALRNELAPIFCVGETADERERREMETVLERQIKRGLAGLHHKDVEHLVVAYEPIWAIGTGKTATADQIAEAHHFLRNLLEKLYDAPTAVQVRILYGGSVAVESAGLIAELNGVDGFLVGGASLTAGDFAEIVRTAELKIRKR